MNRLVLAIALILVAYSSGGSSANYAEKADGALAFVEKTLADNAKGIYRARPGEPDYASLRAQSLQLFALSSAAGYNPEKYRPGVARLAKGMAEFSAGREVSSLDSALEALALLDAYEVAKDPGQLARAQRAFDSLKARWGDDHGGIGNGERDPGGRDGVANAATAVLALRLGKLTGKWTEYLPWAEKIYAWMNSRLRDSDGLYRQGGMADDSGWKTDGIRSEGAAGLMIRAGLMLHAGTEKKEYLQEAVKTAESAERHCIRVSTGAFTEGGWGSVALNEALIELSRVANDRRYLRLAQRNADFVYRMVRDAKGGGYWSRWEMVVGRSEPKTLESNASAARLFAVLAAYPDKEELYDAGIRAATAGEYGVAAERFADAVAIDDTYVEAHYRLYRCRLRLGDQSNSEASMARLTQLYMAGGLLRDRLKAVALPEVLRIIEARTGM